MCEQAQCLLQVQSARLEEAQQAGTASQQSLAASELELQALQKLHTTIQIQLRAAREEVAKYQAQAESNAADLAVLQRVHEIVKGELDEAKSSKSPK